MHSCLKEGWIWINLGPLKWHFENNPPGAKSGEDREAAKSRGRAATEDEGIGDPGSVELTDEEVILLVEKLGFRVEKHKTMQIETGYIGNTKSMSRGIYHPSFWIARKITSS